MTTDAAPEAGPGHDGVARRSVALKAVLPETGDNLTPSEKALLSEWLDRLADRPG